MSIVIEGRDGNDVNWLCGQQSMRREEGSSGRDVN
jgi:hypothetical protein